MFKVVSCNCILLQQVEWKGLKFIFFGLMSLLNAWRMNAMVVLATLESVSVKLSHP